MPTFEITSPDGRKFEVTGPEGSTEEEALARVKAEHGGYGGGAEGGFMDTLGKIGGSVVRGLKAPLDLGRWLAGPKETGPDKDPFGAALSEGANKVEQALPQWQSPSGRIIGGGIESISNPLSFVGPGGVLAKSATALTSGLGAKTAGEMVHGRGGMIEPAVEMAGAVVGGQIPRAASRFAAGMRTPPERQPHVDVLRREGIEPTAGDVTGSPTLRKAETTLGDAPGGGGAGAREHTRIAEEFEQALNKKIGMPGERHTTPEVLQRARDRYSTMLENAQENLPIKYTQPLGDELVAVAAEAQRRRLPPETINQLKGLIAIVNDGFETKGSAAFKKLTEAKIAAAFPQLTKEQVADAFKYLTNRKIAADKSAERAAGMPAGTMKSLQEPIADTSGPSVMSGATYQALTRKNGMLDLAIKSNNPDTSFYAMRIRGALDEAMERTAKGQGTQPGKGMRKAFDELREARRGWYNTMVIGKAAASTGENAPAGIVTPQKLRALIANTEDHKIQYALGKGDLTELVRAGNAILTRPGSSQTAERSLITTIPAAIGAATGQFLHGEPVSGALMGAVAPGLAGRALNSPLGQGFLKGQLPGQAAARVAADALPSSASTAARSLLGTPLSTPMGGSTAGTSTGEGGGGEGGGEGGGGGQDTDRNGQNPMSAGPLAFGDPNRYQTWPERGLRAFVDALKVPGEVAQGKIDMTTQEGLEKATDLALATMTGGAFGTGKQIVKEGFLGGAYNKATQNLRNKTSGISHPGFRFGVENTATGKIAAESPAMQLNMARAETQAKLLNEYYKTNKFRVKYDAAEKLTAAEEKTLRELGLLDQYRQFLSQPGGNFTLGSGPVGF